MTCNCIMYHQILLTQITVTVLLATEDDRRSINRNLSYFKLEVKVHFLHKIINSFNLLS